MKYFLPYLLLLLSLCAFAQRENIAESSQATAKDTAKPDTAKEKLRLFIVPFNDQMFYTDLYRALDARDKVAQQRIKNRFRQASLKRLTSALTDSLKIESTVRPDSVYPRDLRAIYETLSYRFMAIDQFNKKGKKKKLPKNPNRGIVKGEVVSERDTTPRYMAASVGDTMVFQRMFEEYGANRFLLINQFDFQHDLSNPNQAFINPSRVLQLHYTFVNKRGRVIGGGIAKRKCGTRENNIERIIGNHMYALAAEVAHGLMPPPETKKGKKKAKVKKSKN